ncbi:hypothetical protein glysoja_016246 [Glycine soja]|nr:hypothetical protein glysoja_016246 [Glycine soja]
MTSIPNVRAAKYNILITVYVQPHLQKVQNPIFPKIRQGIKTKATKPKAKEKSLERYRF